MSSFRLTLSSIAVLIVGCASSGNGGKSDPTMSERTEVLPVMTTDQGRMGVNTGNALTLVSINLAHGRKKSLNQWLVSHDKTLDNLDDIATFLIDTDADVVALQEADAPSAWSGKFDHVEYLAKKGGFPYFTYGEHARIGMGNYGTAILSRWPIEEAVALTFPATPPTAQKGFTLAKIQWGNPESPGDSILMDIVSVHLDFSRKSVRRGQVDELVEILGPRHNPLVIMGDINSEWLARKYIVDSFSESSEMHVYEADNEDLTTYRGKRLDWILLSRDLEFSSYRTEKSALSDHKAIVARVAFSHVEPYVEPYVEPKHEIQLEEAPGR